MLTFGENEFGAVTDEEQRSSFARWWPRLGAALLAALIWFGGFATGFFPWLGYRSFAFHALEARSGAPFDLSSPLGTETETNFGSSAMLLFAGQTAYIDYEVGGDPGEKIYLDIAPWPAIKFSKHMRYAEAGQSGRFEVPIVRTGVYEFRAEVSAGSYRQTLNFVVSWGAEH